MASEEQIDLFYSSLRENNTSIAERVFTDELKEHLDLSVIEQIFYRLCAKQMIEGCIFLYEHGLVDPSAHRFKAFHLAKRNLDGDLIRWLNSIEAVPMRERGAGELRLADIATEQALEVIAQKEIEQELIRHQREEEIAILKAEEEERRREAEEAEDAAIAAIIEAELVMGEPEIPLTVLVPIRD